MTYTFPPKTPPLTYESLRPLAVGHLRERGPGSALALSPSVRVPSGWGAPGTADLGGAVLPAETRNLSSQWVGIRLRETLAAVIGPEWVAFPRHGLHDELATAWLAKVVTDNGISSGLYLKAGGYFVTLDESCPVEGRAYKAGAQLDRPEDRYLGTGAWRTLLLGDHLR
jgi:hypothetical protein